MPTAIASLQSVSPYSQSKFLLEKKASNESHEEFEQRIWPERCHYTQDGHVMIPPMAFKQAVDSAAKYGGFQKKGKSTWTKHFVSGVLCVEPLVLPYTRDDLTYWAGPCNSQGNKDKSGGATVVRMYPVIPEWSGTVRFEIIDDEIHKDIFEKVLHIAGRNIGIGRFRPQNGGFNGRFSVQSLRWE